MSYIVWIQIEDIGNDDDEALFENVALPDPLGTFDELAEAQAFVGALLILLNPEMLATSGQVTAPEVPS